jgi:hypothetical protein
MLFSAASVAQDQQQDSQQPQQNQPQPEPSTQNQDAQQKPAEQEPSDKSGNNNNEEKKNDNPAVVVAGKTKNMTVQAARATAGKVRDWETEWLVGAYVGRNRPLVPLTGEGREEIYLHQTFLTPGAYLKRMFSAAIDQARGVPSQWDGGVKGYTERWASREGQFFAANSLAALGNAKLHYEPRYDQCHCQGFWPRTKHAIMRNFMTYNETERELRPQWALYGGAFGGGLISDAWKPKPRNPWAEGGRAVLGQAGWGALQNFFNEFGVDINRKLGREK